MLSEENRYQLLKLLEQKPKMSQRQIADAMGISLGKTNYCLKALIERGYIKATNFRKSETKGAYAYILTANGIKEKARVTVQFLKRKQREYDDIVAEIARLESEVEAGVAVSE